VNRSDIVGRCQVGWYDVDERIGHGINLTSDGETRSETGYGRRGRREGLVSEDK
jgi:hypothetical protein